MKILLTGANGYIGKRLLPALIQAGHHVVCCVRDINRFSPPPALQSSVEVIEADLLDRDSLEKIPADIDAAYYLVHSMSSSDDYQKLEKQSAIHFCQAVEKTSARQVIYLSGIVNDTSLSKHLASRKAVEAELSKGSYHTTTLRAGVIIGSGSGSFEIIRDLVEKLPVMVAPKWLNTRCQPIAVSDVIAYLVKSLLNPAVYDRNFDIGSPDILTYKQVLLGYARARGLKRRVLTVPVMTPKLSSYWLFFVTSTSYKLAIALVDSMKVEVVCRSTDIGQLLNHQPLSYSQALEDALNEVVSNQVLSSWKDSLVSGAFKQNISEFIEVPTYGCFVDRRTEPVRSSADTLERIWTIGGDKGWYHATWLWQLRGFIDKLFGGVGLRRGRTRDTSLSNGETVDFWRVLYADQETCRLLLFAEMKLPGEAWLEFKISQGRLIQTATFRPKGLAGRLYWFAVYPLHGYIFQGMIRAIAR